MKPLTLRALQAPGVFACQCEIYPDTIAVGILIVDAEVFEARSGAAVTLFNPEGQESYAVQLPRLNAFATTQLSLPRHHDQTPLV
jgi:hypothetical protein